MVTGYQEECAVLDTEWDSTIVMSGYKTEDLCTVLVVTDGGNCADFCSA